MISDSNSTLTWLDSSDRERRATLELVSALSEPGTLDELGIGRIRDTIADTLFPGTSTVQTRARYFLFLPWIMQKIEEGSSRSPNERARYMQLELCNALGVSHGSGEGVIGREAGAALRRWPLDIYWAGLRRWGIRRYPGSLSAYFAKLRQPGSRRATNGANGTSEYGEGDALGNWAELPPPPAGFPEGASFALTVEDAKFIRDRIELSAPHSYLAHILRTGVVVESDFPWVHPAADTASPSVRDWLQDARLFSLVHRGGMLLYNLTLAELVGDDEGVDRHSRNLKGWSQDMTVAENDLANWDMDSMWKRLRRVNPRLPVTTMDFVKRWYSIACSSRASLSDNSEARVLIRNRERVLKGRRARLTYPEARDSRRGYPASGRLTFRWGQVRQITSDVLTALEDDNA